MNATTEERHDRRSVNVENWSGYEDQINQIFALYRDRVNPLVAVYNSVTDKFPIGVLNELRDIFSHLVQSLEDPEATARHLKRAQSHCKRAAVDGFKYAAFAYSTVYDNFKETYKNVDLSYVDNGQLLPKLTRLYAEAGDLMTKARLIEASPHTEDEMYEAYEDAFNCYAELYKCIRGAMDAAETISMRAQEDMETRKREHRTDRTIGICGVIIGIVGVVVGFFV